MVRVKICGITNANDLSMALHEGADALGFVFEPSSPRYVGDHQFDIYLNLAQPYAVTAAVFGVVHRQVPDANVIQGVRFDEPVMPNQALVQAIRVREGMTVEQIVQAAESASTILLDAFSTHEYGGTGKQVDWDIAASATKALGDLGKVVVLAGGLTPDNVAEAIVKVRPYAVDVSSGVELSPGVKDVYKVRDFIQAAKSAI